MPAPWGEGAAASGAGASPGGAGSGGESSGGDETAKKKRRSKPRGGRGHGGRSKKDKDAQAGPGMAGRRAVNTGPGLLPDPDPDRLPLFARGGAGPGIELQLPKHLAARAAAQAAAGGKAPRRPAMATELRVESFNPYARKTPSNTPGAAVTPATQLALSIVDFALDSPAMNTRNAHGRLASQGFTFPSPKAQATGELPPALPPLASESGGKSRQQGHDVSLEVKKAVEWWVSCLSREEVRSQMHIHFEICARAHYETHVCTSTRMHIIIPSCTAQAEGKLRRQSLVQIPRDVYMGIWVCVCVFVYLFDRCRSRAHVTYEIIGNAACGKPAKESFRRNTVQGAGISVHVSLVSFLSCVCVCTNQTDTHAFHVHSVSVCMFVRTFIRIFTYTRAGDRADAANTLKVRVCTPTVDGMCLQVPSRPAARKWLPVGVD